MPYIIDGCKIVKINVSNNTKPLPYKMNDLGSVYTHYDKDKGCNVPTENKLNGGMENNGKSSKQF